MLKASAAHAHETHELLMVLPYGEGHVRTTTHLEVTTGVVTCRCLLVRFVPGHYGGEHGSTN